jgi:hypothetical protein
MTRFLRLLPGLCLALAVFAAAPTGSADGDAPFWRTASAEGKSARPEPPPSLRQRRRTARQENIQNAATQCRVVARALAAMQTRPCAVGDRLDARGNVCHAPKNIWMPYVRWDPAAGRCRPRDSFDGAVCVGTRQRYEPGRRHAQSLSRSVGMYGHATAQLESRLDSCRQAATGLRHKASDERMKDARRCEQARKLNRGDLADLYCG